MSDKCSDCFIHHDNEPIMCEKCGQKSMNYKWNEPCVTWTCSNCGYSVVGSGFWAPCSLDETGYKIKVVSENLSNKDLVTVSKAAKISALEVKNAENEFFNKSYDLETAKRIEAIFINNGIEHEIEPKPEYSEYEKCRTERLP